jgi:disulfide bond formation protein DsbB
MRNKYATLNKRINKILLKMLLKQSPTFFLISVLLSCGLGFAYYVQYYLGIEPCSLCYTQRYIFMTCIAIFFVGSLFVKYFESIKYLALIAIMVNTGFSFFHVGVEQKWWEGPKTCQSKGKKLDLNHLSDADALKQLQEHLEQKSFVPCDKISWRILGIPATVLNTLYLLFLTILTMVACGSCQKKAYGQFFRRY